MMIEIPETVDWVLKTLNEKGYQAYLVGGWVRDQLLGRRALDADVTTSAHPNQVKEAFAGYTLLDTGIDHGTVTLLAEDKPVEITTFRVDGAYSDFRRPNQVRFTRSLKEDASRRDFTINAMAYHPEEGLMDFFHGREDLEQRCIRCVGDPDRRFGEDALRILRALRFASELEFELERETRQGVFRNRMLLKEIAAERIASEMVKIICGPGAKKVFLEYAEVLGVVIPQILPMIGFQQMNPHHVYDVLTHSLVVMENLPGNAHMRYAGLLHDVAKPLCFTVDEKGVGHFYGHPKLGARIAEDILSSLRMDRFTIERAKCLIEYHDVRFKPEKKMIKRWLNRLSPEVFFQLIQLQRADCLGKAPPQEPGLSALSEIEEAARAILAEGECFTLKDLAVSGRDILELGALGKEVGILLNDALEAVISGEVCNEKQALREFLKGRRTGGLVLSDAVASGVGVNKKTDMGRVEGKDDHGKYNGS